MRPIATTPTTISTNATMLSPNSSASTTAGTLPLTRVSQARENLQTSPSGILDSQFNSIRSTTGLYGLLNRSGFTDASSLGQHILRNEQSATDRRSSSRPHTRPSSHTNNSDLTTRQHTTTRSTTSASASASSSLASEPAQNPGARPKTTRNNQVQTTRNPHVRARREAAAASSSSTTASTRNSGSEANQRAQVRVRRDAPIAVASSTSETATSESTTTISTTPTPTAAVGEFVCGEGNFINGTIPEEYPTPGKTVVEHCKKIIEITHKSNTCRKAAYAHCNGWIGTTDLTDKTQCRAIKKYVDERKGQFDTKYQDLNCDSAGPPPTSPPDLPTWAWVTVAAAGTALGALLGSLVTMLYQKSHPGRSGEGLDMKRIQKYEETRFKEIREKYVNPKEDQELQQMIELSKLSKAEEDRRHETPEQKDAREGQEAIEAVAKQLAKQLAKQQAKAETRQKELREQEDKNRKSEDSETKRNKAKASATQSNEEKTDISPD